MPHGSQYRHYIRRIDGSYGDNINWVDIEDSYDGLIYLSAKGLNDIGKSKNIYTEEYADSDRKRVYLPPSDADYANEGTVVEMTFVVVGDEISRSNTINNFCDEIRHGVHSYYDTARYREFDFIVTDEINVSDERWHGSQPYVELTIRMQNLNGKTMPVHSN